LLPFRHDGSQTTVELAFSIFNVHC
jgi:hypothetical protein